MDGEQVGDARGWTSDVPALGVEDFALVDGTVLSVVSPVARELSPADRRREC